MWSASRRRALGFDMAPVARGSELKASSSKCDAQQIGMSPAPGVATEKRVEVDGSSGWRASANGNLNLVLLRLELMVRLQSYPANTVLRDYVGWYKVPGLQRLNPVNCMGGSQGYGQGSARVGGTAKPWPRHLLFSIYKSLF
jgi:hypothetical protein